MARQYYHAAQGAEVTAATTTYVDAVTLNFTPDASSTYYFIWSADWGGFTNGGNIRVIDGASTVYETAQHRNKDSAPTPYHSMGGIFRVVFGASPGAQSFKIQINNLATSTSRCARGRIIAIKGIATDEWAESTGAVFEAGSTSDTTEHTLSWTPASTKDYLVLGSIVHSRTNQSGTQHAKLKNTAGTAVSSGYSQIQNTTDRFVSLLVGYGSGLSAAQSWTITLVQSVATNQNHSNRRLLALDITGELIDEMSVADGSTVTSTSYGDSTSWNFTANNAAEHLIFATGGWCISANASSGYSNFLIDGVQSAEAIDENATSNTLNIYGRSIVRLEDLTAASHTLKIQLKGETATITSNFQAKFLAWDIETGVGGSVGYSITITADTVAVTGQTVTPAYGRAISITADTVAVTGQTVTPAYGRVVSITPDTVAVTGQTVTPVYERAIAITAATVAISGELGTGTWDSAKKHSSFTLSNGDLTATTNDGTDYRSVLATVSQGSDLVYYEGKFDPRLGDAAFGFGNASTNLATWLGINTNSVGIFVAPTSGGAIDIWHNNVAIANWALGSVPTRIRIVFKRSTKEIWVAGDGSNWNNSGTAVPGTSGGITASGLSTSGDYFPGFNSRANGDGGTINLGGSPYFYTPPAGATNWDGSIVAPTYVAGPGGGVGYSITITAGTVDVTGQTVTPVFARTISITPDTVDVTGQTVTPAYGRAISITADTVAITGQTVTPVSARTISITADTVAITGQTVTPAYGRAITITADTVAIVGQTVTPVFARTISITADTVAITGQTVTPVFARTISITADTVPITGQTITPAYGRAVSITAGTVAITGQTVTPVSARTISVTAGTVDILGQTVTPLHGIGYAITVTAGTVAITGQTVTPAYGRAITITAGTVDIAGQTVTPVIARTISITPDTVDIVGQTVTPAYGYSIVVAADTVPITGETITLVWSGGPVDYGVSITAGTVAITGQTVTLSVGITASWIAGWVQIVGQTVTPVHGYTVSITADTVPIAGGTITPIHGTGSAIAVTAGTVAITGQTVTPVFVRQPIHHTITVVAGTVSIVSGTISPVHTPALVVTGGPLVTLRGSVQPSRGLEGAAQITGDLRGSMQPSRGLEGAAQITGDLRGSANFDDELEGAYG